MNGTTIAWVRWSTPSGNKAGLIRGDKPGEKVPINDTLASVVADCRARNITVAEWAEDWLRQTDKRPEIFPDERLKPLELSELWGCEMGQEPSSEENSRVGEPSFFFKATGLRVANPGTNVGLRPDAAWHVPEPCLTVVFDDEGKVLGYTIGLDITARDLEEVGDRYRTISKIFHLSAAIGPTLALADTFDPTTLVMTMEIRRRGGEVFNESCCLAIRTSGEELGAGLSRAMPLLPWTGLMMGTAIHTPAEFQLEDGDEIAITVPGLGTLKNTVKVIDSSWVDVPVGSSRILRIDPRDTVAVSLGTLSRGQQVHVGNRLIDVAQDIPFGHKVAVAAMAQGDWVIKYGEKIGVASINIRPGEHVHTHNLESSRGRGDLATQESGVK